jgi:hypothetical protein
LPAAERALTDRGRPLGDATAERDFQGVWGYRAKHGRDAHIGALAVHRQ